MSSFKFTLGQQAQIAVSGETGQIIARAEYTTGTNSYLLRYKSADGRAVEAWWNEDAVNISTDPQCTLCGGTGTIRAPYYADSSPCPACCSARASMLFIANTSWL